MENSNRKKPNASNEVRHALVVFLSQRHKNGRLEKGAIDAAKENFPFGKSQINRIWQRARGNVVDPNVQSDYTSKKMGNSGRKPKYSQEAVLATIGQTPFSQRQTLRSMSNATSIPASTLCAMRKKGWFLRHSNAIKPLLTEENKIARLIFAKSFVNPRTQRFDAMYDYVHIDEKWFYMTKINANYYLVPGEEPPHRTCKSKRYITKVMFMCAVARPRWDPAANRQFDGKIGVWPFIFKEAAKRSSKNRRAGTMETKCITSINRMEMKKMLVEKVIPAIKQKWPVGSTRCIIQQDNAKPHTTGGDNAIMEAMVHDRIRMELTNQPPNSPDFNVLDLGFFNSIQALQHQHSPKTIDDLVAATEAAFTDMQSTKLDNVFLSYQMAMQSAMEVGGGNNYKLQHIGKAKLRREGRLSNSIKCSNLALQAANAHLNGETGPVAEVIPDGVDELNGRIADMFLSDEDATFASEHDLEPVELSSK